MNDLAHSNVFALLASLLRASPHRLEDVTLVLIPRVEEGRANGFYVLADQYTPGPLKGRLTANSFWITLAQQADRGLMA